MENNVTFNLMVPQSNGIPIDLTLRTGESLFLLGANGTGKSSLMHQFYTPHHPHARRISAHRQTWLNSNAINLSPEQKRATDNNIKGSDTNLQARWKDDHAAQRASVAIYDLIDAENVRARAIAAAVTADAIDVARSLSKKDAPIEIINQLLHLSNMPINISVRENEQIVASKSSGATYSIAELSDGERNAILIAADVLTAKPGTLFIIDEPERHLHRSIISPLLTLLFAQRRDCAFIISTHDVMLPLDNPSAQTLLIRSCTYSGSSVTSWEADIVSPGTEIDDDLKKDILGSRRKTLFVEGNEQSLDKPLYSIVFPNISIISKASCRDVEHAVSGIRDANNIHWLHAFGIVDNDRRTPEDLSRLKSKGIYAVSVYSVESIYYHPEIQRRVVERSTAITGEDAFVKLGNAKTAAFTFITPHAQRLSERTAEKVIREQFFQHLPNRKDISNAAPINITININDMVAQELKRFQEALASGDLQTLIERYPIRETPALTEIAVKLGFQHRTQYESAVRKLLMDDQGALDFVRSLFGTLASDIGAI